MSIGVLTSGQFPGIELDAFGNIKDSPHPIVGKSHACHPPLPEEPFGSPACNTNQPIQLSPYRT